MKTFWIKTVAALMIAALLTIGAYRYQDTRQPVAEITFPLGNVLVQPKGKNKMQKASFKQKLYNGDKIKTQPKSRCEIKFNDGTVVRIDEQSIYTIQKAEIKKTEKKVESFLSLGRLWANVQKLARNTDKWLLKGPSAVVAVRGTVYRMDANKDKSSRVLVYEGKVAVSPSWNPAGTGDARNNSGPPRQVNGPTQVSGPRVVSMEEWLEIIKAQQQIVVTPDGKYTKSEFDPAADARSSWVQWNLERDKLLKR